MSRCPSHHTLLIEQLGTGHRLFYLRLLAEAELAGGHEVTVAMPEAVRSLPEFRIHMSHLHERIEFLFIESLDLESIAQAAISCCASLTVVPDGDSTAYRLSRVGRWTGPGCIAVLVMREFAQPSRSATFTAARTIMKRILLTRVSQVKNVELRILKSATWSGHSRFRTTPDPVVLSASDAQAEELRRSWDVEADTYWFGMMGYITDRKNPILIAQALRLASSIHPESRLGLIVAGQVQPALKAELSLLFDSLAAAGVKVRVRDEALEDHELDGAVRLADCLVLAHSNEGPSGLLGKSAAAGTRVIASGASSLRSDIGSLGHGAHWCKLTVEDVAQAMGSALTQSAPLPSQVAGPTEFANSLLVF